MLVAWTGYQVARQIIAHRLTLADVEVLERSKLSKVKEKNTYEKIN